MRASVIRSTHLRCLVTGHFSDSFVAYAQPLWERSLLPTSHVFNRIVGHKRLHSAVRAALLSSRRFFDAFEGDGRCSLVSPQYSVSSLAQVCAVIMMVLVIMVRIMIMVAVIMERIMVMVAVVMIMIVMVMVLIMMIIMVVVVPR